MGNTLDANNPEPAGQDDAAAIYKLCVANQELLRTICANATEESELIALVCNISSVLEDQTD